MDPTWLMIAQTGGKLFGDANNEKTTKEMRAAELRAMPWTGRGPSTSAQFASPWATLGTAATGYMDQMNRLAGAKAEMDYRNKLLDRMAPAPAMPDPVIVPPNPATPAANLRNSRDALSQMLGYDVEAPASNPWDLKYRRGF